MPKTRRQRRPDRPRYSSLQVLSEVKSVELQYRRLCSVANIGLTLYECLIFRMSCERRIKSTNDV